MFDACNNSVVPDGSFTRLGPAQLFAVLGPGILLSLYSSLLLLLFLLWCHGLYWLTRVKGGGGATAMLQLIPVLSFSLTLPVFLSPPTAPLVTLIQDGLAITAMSVFTHFTLALVGGAEGVARILTAQGTQCPLGTPPLCCLLPCPRPQLTTRIFKLLLLPLRLLSVALVFNILVNLFLVFSGFYPLNKFLAVESIHNFLLIPFLFSTMYSYKILVGVISPLIPDTRCWLRGMLNFFMFVIGKTCPTVLQILHDYNLIPCLRGLPSRWVAVLLAALMQVVLLSVPALSLPRLYAHDWDAVRTRLTVTALKKEVPHVDNDKEDEKLVPLVLQDQVD